MSATYPLMDFAPTVTAILLVAVFAAAEFTAHYTVVYRRNNLGVAAALLLSAAAVWFFSWAGFLAFTAGTFAGAWIWLSGIRAANENLHRAAGPLTHGAFAATVDDRGGTHA